MHLSIRFRLIVATLLLIIEILFKFSCNSLEKTIHYIQFRNVRSIFLKNEAWCHNLEINKRELTFCIPALTTHVTLKHSVTKFDLL